MDENYDPDYVTEFEIETWDRCADSYVDTFAGITNETLDVLIEAGKIGSGSEVLEIGSGPGNFAGLLAKAGANVTGIDFASDMVKVASRKYPHITFNQADAEKLPFENSSFDTVVANFVVHHLARPEKVFREAGRVLRPGGRFTFAVWGDPEGQSSIGAFFAAVAACHDLGDLPHGPLFGVTSKDVFEPLFEQAGFECCQLSIHNMFWKTGSIDPVINGFSDWGNLALLPQETQDNIINLTIENSKPYRQEDGYKFPHEILVGSAVKT